MLQLEFGGRTISIPTGDSAIGADPAGLLALPGAQPKHVVLKGAADGTVSVLPQAGAGVNYRRWMDGVHVNCAALRYPRSAGLPSRAIPHARQEPRATSQSDHSPRAGE